MLKKIYANVSDNAEIKWDTQCIKLERQQKNQLIQSAFALIDEKMDKSK